MRVNTADIATHKHTHEHSTNIAKHETIKTQPHRAHNVPVVVDTAILLVIATSDTFTVQPLQYVSPDAAVDSPE